MHGYNTKTLKRINKAFKLLEKLMRIIEKELKETEKDLREYIAKLLYQTASKKVD